MQANIVGSMELFTPERAAEILQTRNPSNRPLRPAVVSGYAREMREGRWHSGVTDAIGFTSDGMLVNGQHRLSAVVMSGVTVHLFVAHNVPADASAYMDIGAKRSISDRTNLQRRDTDVVTGLIRVLGGGVNAAMDPQKVATVHRAFAHVIAPFSSGAKTNRAVKGATASMRGALAMLAADGMDVNRLMSQFNAYINGNEEMTAPVAALRKELTSRRSRISTTDREAVFAASIQAFAARSGRERDIITEYRAKFGLWLRGA